MTVRRRFSEFIADLESRGRHHFTTEDAARWSGTSRTAVLPALKRLADSNKIVSPARGFYCVVTPRHRAWGAPPAAWYIDAWMKHIGRSYYVALLSAAQQLGASHQSPQVFQVAVDRDVRNRSVGRSRIQFFGSARTAQLPTLRRNVPTGTINVSTGEATALDLVARPLASGGISNVATILIELRSAGELTSSRVKSLWPHYKSAVVRRSGYLMERYCQMHFGSMETVRPNKRPAIVDLVPGGPRRGRVDPRWRVRVNASVEPDA